ncbi:hypothetical protein RKLH11_2054 [Rhodobacteraceae bacterium KLH11]|nr:hypothetical protein RKLH11_2054 [Rhodobacteraceae bacterium KLH11]
MSLLVISLSNGPASAQISDAGYETRKSVVTEPSVVKVNGHKLKLKFYGKHKAKRTHKRHVYKAPKKHRVYKPYPKYKSSRRNYYRYAPKRYYRY